MVAQQAPLPKPLRAATSSMPRSVSSSSRCARSTRCRVSHLCGVVPVSATNRRAKLRSDMRARLARSDTECSTSRCSSTQSSTGASPSARQTGIGCSTYWRCPPSRCGGTTIRRAIALTTLWPSSRRMRCRQASMPAAVPALVTRSPSSTNSTSGSTFASG
ncbi:hypothetical protein BJF78_28430 [Pseudonocardia sp. CNS-139]|nr:hypothetical protein BJF78_28430 [Pseudonocardia sp. CNS-139]